MSAAMDIRHDEADLDRAIMAEAVTSAFQGMGLILRNLEGEWISIHAAAPLIAERMLAFLQRYAAGEV